MAPTDLDGSRRCGATRSRAHRSPSIWRVGLLLFLVILAAPMRGQAQWISPGPLTEAHTSLEGTSNCVKCHRLGRKGVDDDRCLSCHVTLETRVRAGRGYHASVRGQACADCHKDHFGLEFATVRMDTATFDHAETGYPLEGGHADALCVECHSAGQIKAADVIAWGREHGVLGRTLLGLDDSCQGCHLQDDPHGGQFPDQECETCHATVAWEQAERFDHDRTGYRLTGEHRQVSCDGCHPEKTAGSGTVVQYTGLTAECDACHDDEHLGVMGADCTGCHDPRSWIIVNRSAVTSLLDHNLTKYALKGRHVEASCEACHARPQRVGDAIRIRLVAGTEGATFPEPHAASCADCHVDAHSAELAERPDRGSCESCHDELGWTPASFGVDRHNEETDYPLTGAHLVTFCSDCHGVTSAPGEAVKLEFTVEGQSCVSCHLKDDPHAEVYGDVTCEECHGTVSFAVATFDHDSAGSLTCRSCHASEDPHAGQFVDPECEQCHGTVSFLIPDFDHSETRFPLEGEHLTVACAGCHTLEADAEGREFVRYRPMSTECAPCHGNAP